MANPRDKYHTELFKTTIECNNFNDEHSSNEKIIDPINLVIEEEEENSPNITLDAHNVSANTFSMMSNTYRENSNVILTSEKLDKSEVLTETLNNLNINNS